MEYLEQAKKEIREIWFGNHKIKTVEGQEGFQRIIWGEEGTSMYQVVYVLSGNMVFITGDLGDASYSLTCRATLENIEEFELSYFTSKLTSHQRNRWNFDYRLAQEEIESYFFDWLDIDHVDELDEDNNELFEELLSETRNWNSTNHFQTAVFSIYNRTNVDWFDSETASCIAKCGQRLSRSFIAYWVGLQMVIEQLKQKESKTEKER